jgi:TonB family protein
MRWSFVALCGLAGGWLFVSPAAVAQDRCAQTSVAGVRPGLSVDDVRAALRVKPGLSHQVVLTDGTRVTMEDYNLSEGVVHVQYDGPANRGATRVALVWQPLRATEETVTSLLQRLGEPDSGRDDLVGNLEQGSAVWIQPMCDQVVTYYRRPRYWIGDDNVSTVLRAEKLSQLADGSPAADTVRAWQASRATAPQVEVATAAPSEPKASESKGEAPPAAPPPRAANTTGDIPAEVTRYVLPVYPKRAQEQGVKGVVKLRVLVLKSGKVATVRVADVEPEGYGFEQAAVAAVEQWKFAPARVQGQAVDGFTDVAVEFP